MDMAYEDIILRAPLRLEKSVVAHSYSSHELFSGLDVNVVKRISLYKYICVVSCTLAPALMSQARVLQALVAPQPFE